MLDRRSFLCLLSVAPLALSGCGASQGDEAPEATTGGEEQTTGVPNPFVDCESAYDVAQLAGLDVTFPESVPGCSERAYQAIEGQLAQCRYSEGDTSVLIRKGVDDGSGDLSGDYNEYPEEATVSVGDLEVTERGSDGLVFVAIWAKDGYLYAIDADGGLDPETIASLVTATL